MEDMTDEQLVDLVRQHDEDAYRILMERHKDYIYTLIYRMVEHRETAEDLTQEVFIKLYRNLDRFRGDSQLKTWLYRLTVNLVTDYRRSRQRRPVEAILDKVKGWFGDRREEPEARLLQSEDRETVQSLLAGLPDKYKLILYLYHYKQLSYQEISEVTGLGLKTVETRLYRGKSLLKEKWLEVRGHEHHASKRTRSATLPE
ncbi:RNA polymerase sigma factor [Paenibacillus mucilaginosus]|uniref:RNA polymerase ECF-type sigma factor n=3 Tax=Paenibacillus mucilaginosus TaxID=61624 RepID=H6NBR0_9BACL|nr:sigma-70 family RNA polymerase sigma factor [Paenibacillus mucilaginosus]AFC27861.1 RNA polymerase ECF-type sigma factor [Paenibacillus mucilaginosus 3016]AFH60015.1 RNA polymerase sigma70 factor [Paenibacillus mucilaginosus K02]WDM31117.1 sigma-70 family RNA polymerase sigma factor [Paenibacillus mucilaginosus]WFA22461.1 sigma-70 family RNA polymerase sigma factor [Paenibacillus mucilaginosus]